MEKWQEIVAKADAAIMSGWQVYFKFTCQACGERPVLNEANTLYEKGECCICGHETDLKAPEAMLGFMIISRVGGNNAIVRDKPNDYLS